MGNGWEAGGVCCAEEGRGGGAGWRWEAQSDRKVVSLRRGGPVKVNGFFLFFFFNGLHLTQFGLRGSVCSCVHSSMCLRLSPRIPRGLHPATSLHALPPGVLTTLALIQN